MDRRALLADQDWSRISKQLTHFAWKAIRMKSLDEARDLAQEAISDEFEQPTWDPEKHTLLRHLGCRVVGLAKNAWRRRRTRNQFEVEMDSMPDSTMPSNTYRPEHDAWGRQFATQLAEEVRDDALARNVMRLVLEGVELPAEQARLLHVSRAEIELAMRRLRDFANKVSAALSTDIERADDEAAARARDAFESARSTHHDPTERPTSDSERDESKEATQ